MMIRSATLGLLASAILLAEGSACDAQTRIRSGITGAATINTHRGAFGTYDGIQECGTFDNATTIGWQGGYLLDLPFGGSFGLSTRLSYWKADGDFTSPNPFAVRVAIDDQTTVPLVTENTLETSLDYVMLDALVRWNAGPVYVAVGPSVGLATRAAYEQQERIISPQGITFQNGESTRKIIAGNFDQQGTVPARREIRIGGSAALGVEIPLSERFMLAPEVGISYPLTNVLSSFEWKVSAIRAGASLTYAFGDESRRDTDRPPVVAPRPAVAFELRNQRADGSRAEYAAITLREERRSDVIPLLPYLFFPANGSDIPDRYRKLSPSATGSFVEEALHDSVLDVYHDLLNIVGARMRAHPEATIAVTGCREPLDDAGSTNALSTARAEAVKSYLVSAWNISPDRIGTVAQVLPKTPSVRGVDDGREENRRAEIRSTDPRILAPITRRFTTRAIDPPAIALLPDIQYGDSITSWRLNVLSSNGASIWRKEGSGAPGDLLWSVEESAVAGSAPDGKLIARLEATTTSGETIRAERAIPIRREISSRRYNGEVVRDSLVERFNMIFFDFDTPRISDFNGEVVGLIRSRMRTSSSVTITGLTDRVGDPEHNDALSTERAGAVSDAIRSRIVPERVRTEGAGERLIYDNDLPEGRMYNRTVIIEIATPQEP